MCRSKWTLPPLRVDRAGKYVWMWCQVYIARSLQLDMRRSSKMFEVEGCSTCRLKQHLGCKKEQIKKLEISNFIFNFPESSKYRNNKILPANFTGLVLGCIEAKFCKSILVGKLSQRFTQCTPLHRFGFHNRKLGKKELGQNNPEKVKMRGH